MSRRLAIALLAAGRSSRMRGGDKLMMPVNARPVLREMAMRALSTKAQVFVSLPGPWHRRALALEGLPVTQVFAPRAPEGMGWSIAGVADALPPSVSGLMIVPSDMPDITAGILHLMVDAWRRAPQGTLIRAQAANGQPGHPVIFPRSSFRALKSLRGDTGAKPVITAHPGTKSILRLDGDGPVTDLDTPEAWRAWTAQQ